MKKKQKELEKKMLAEAETKRAQWLDKNGFNQNKETYVYFPRDSHSVKDQLKDAGFRFSSFLLWHAPQIPEGYEDKVIKVHFNEVAEDSALGDGHYIKDARSKVESAIKQAQPPILSEWIFGKVGDKIKDIKVQLIKKYSFETRYGYSTVYTFQDESENILVWFSSTVQNCEIGDWIKIKYGTIKKLDIYNNIKQTIITRCKLVE